MDEEQQNENCLKRKARVVAGEELEAMMVSSELTGREEFQEAIAGYVRLMQANDKPVFINTKFIVYVEPTKIARYHYTEGSLITLSVSGSAGLQTIKVIEPCEVVMKAIEQSSKSNGQDGKHLQSDTL